MPRTITLTLTVPDGCTVERLDCDGRIHINCGDVWMIASVVVETYGYEIPLTPKELEAVELEAIRRRVQVAGDTMEWWLRCNESLYGRCVERIVETIKNIQNIVFKRMR